MQRGHADGAQPGGTHHGTHAKRGRRAAELARRAIGRRAVARSTPTYESVERAAENARRDAVTLNEASGSASATPVNQLEQPAIAPAHTDWLFHHLEVSGPADPMADFRIAAAGAGLIPWHLDLDRVEEDSFLCLAAPHGQARTLSLEGARILAAELRDAVARRHALAVARVGRSRACCFDLQALVPVPGDVLRLGPDHPDARHWLWTHWGTTDALRHVALAPDARREGHGTPEGVFRVSFWSADWTPWRALATVQARFPALRFEVTPHYALT